MGLFDDVNFEMDCPECGSRVTGFQSKDGPCLMQTVEIEATTTMYSSCKCGHWVELTRSPHEEHPQRTKPATLDDAKKLGFRIV